MNGYNFTERVRKVLAMAREEARLFEQFIIDAPEQWLALFHPIWPDLELRDAKLAQPEVHENGDGA